MVITTITTPTAGAFEGTGNTATLFANEADHTLLFTYTADVDMNGGMVRIAIPGDDWKMPKAGVTVTDNAGTAETLTAADNTGDRLVFTGADDKLTSVAVKLDADWGGTTEKNLTIAIRDCNLRYSPFAVCPADRSTVSGIYIHNHNDGKGWCS